MPGGFYVCVVYMRVNVQDVRDAMADAGMLAKMLRKYQAGGMLPAFMIELAKQRAQRLRPLSKSLSKSNDRCMSLAAHRRITIPTAHFAFRFPDANESTCFNGFPKPTQAPGVAASTPGRIYEATNDYNATISVPRLRPTAPLKKALKDHGYALWHDEPFVQLATFRGPIAISEADFKYMHGTGQSFQLKKKERMKYWTDAAIARYKKAFAGYTPAARTPAGHYRPGGRRGSAVAADLPINFRIEKGRVGYGAHFINVFELKRPNVSRSASRASSHRSASRASSPQSASRASSPQSSSRVARAPSNEQPYAPPRQVVYQCDDDPQQRLVLVQENTKTGPKPLVLVGRSALLQRLKNKGKLPGDPGNGLYAARTFVPEPNNPTRGRDVIGKYGGTYYGPYESRAEAMASDMAKQLKKQSTMVVPLRQHHRPGWFLVDGKTSGPPYIPLANDPRGASIRANCVLTEFGTLKAIQRIPAYDPCDPIKSELRWSYGDDYWKSPA